MQKEEKNEDPVVPLFLDEHRVELIPIEEVFPGFLEKKRRPTQNLSAALDAAVLDAPDFEIGRYEAALCVKRLLEITSNGGSPYGRPEDDDSYLPQFLVERINQGYEHARQTGHFEYAWKQLQGYIHQCKRAWEQGQKSFAKSLELAQSDEEKEYLSQIDFVSMYAYVNAQEFYAKKSMLCQWFIHGYCLAWRKHFLQEEK